MTKKNARKIMLWKAIERYRTAGGREEHHAYKEALANYIDDMLDMSEMDEVAHRFAHPLALELECVLADRNVSWDRAMNLIGEYRSAMNEVHEQHSPTFMGEPIYTGRAVTTTITDPAEIRRVFELDDAEMPPPESGFMKI
jgi:hypothetical protein